MTPVRFGLALGLGAALLLTACSKLPGAPPTVTSTPTEVGERIVITDLNGKEWDITHAVEKYGFDPNGFEFGLGVDTFPAVMDPSFVVAGEPGFPDATANRIVIGADFDGDARAYGITALSRREVINDRFGDAYVAVGY